MSKLKNYSAAQQLFVLILTLALSFGCSPKKFAVQKIEGKEIRITNELGDVAAIQSFIKPYRDHINADLSAVLANAPQTLDKSGKWQTTIGNLFADVCLQLGNPVFEQRENKQMDLVLLNHGGIRSIIPQGDVTARTAYQIMPFENSLVVIELKAQQILDLVNYIIKEKKPHPISGIHFTIDKNNNPKNILIQGKPLDMTKSYFVGTNDYLANGGDNMVFFLKGIATYDLDYKLRNILIDYFKSVDVVPMITDERITVE